MTEEKGDGGVALTLTPCSYRVDISSVVSVKLCHPIGSLCGGEGAAAGGVGGLIVCLYD